MGQGNQVCQGTIGDIDKRTDGSPDATDIIVLQIEVLCCNRETYKTHLG